MVCSYKNWAWQKNCLHTHFFKTIILSPKKSFKFHVRVMRLLILELGKWSDPYDSSCEIVFSQAETPFRSAYGAADVQSLIAHLFVQILQ